MSASRPCRNGTDTNAPQVNQPGLFNIISRVSKEAQEHGQRNFTKLKIKSAGNCQIHSSCDLARPHLLIKFFVERINLASRIVLCFVYLMFLIEILSALEALHLATLLPAQTCL